MAKDKTPNKTHGMHDTPEYKVWSGIKQRCLNPKNPAFINYGGRGITVCDEWIDSFEQFYADMGPRPSSKLTLERVDNDKGYSRDNCKWATRAEQIWNRRPLQNKLGSPGVERGGKGFMARVIRDGVRYRSKTFTTIEEAANEHQDMLRRYSHS